MAAFCGPLCRKWQEDDTEQKASTGFAKNLRNKMFDQIQTYSFANIDHFSTAGLVTSSDNRCDQCAECVPDDAAYDDESTGKYDLCNGDGIYDQCQTGKYLPCGSCDSGSDPLLYHSSCNGLFPAGISKI